ncbi:MAG: hypothetical protein IT558_05970 [Alphaproteobacteria bacterium]|nr:hypothetical protein [Alphaproteobacteria bacterium]
MLTRNIVILMAGIFLIGTFNSVPVNAASFETAVVKVDKEFSKRKPPSRRDCQCGNVPVFP